MPCRGGFRLRLATPSQETTRERAPLAERETENTHALLRLVLWLLRAESDGPVPLPVRVFYKFDSGCWRSRSTHQLHKVYRCR
jgi:hypothetical protein